MVDRTGCRQAWRTLSSFAVTGAIGISLAVASGGASADPPFSTAKPASTTTASASATPTTIPVPKVDVPVAGTAATAAPDATTPDAAAAKKKVKKTAKKKTKGKKKGVAGAEGEQKKQAAVKRTGARGESWPPNDLGSIFGSIFDPAPSAEQASVDPADEEAATKSKKRKVTDAPADEDQLQDDGEGSFTWSLFSVGEPDLGTDLPLGRPTLSPSNVDPLLRAIARYEAIVAAGGWPTVPRVQMGPGISGEAVAILRRRLEIEGDLATGGFFGDTSFDGALEDAVRRFQLRNGLTPTGDILDKSLAKNGTRTLNALNVPASSRLKQLKANLTRIKSFAKTANQRYVMVNIPAQEIEAVAGGKVELRLVGVVGKPDRPSPLLTSAINQLKFNPTWTVPPTVLKEDLVPKGRELARKNQNVLVKYGIDAYDGSGRKLDPDRINWSSEAVFGYRYMQQPGEDNPLGFVKIDFPSPHSVYMHDTPSPRLFEKTYRAASSGCIRVQHVERLATWLLRETGGWSYGRVMSMKENGRTEDVRLKKAVPLYWVYITAWATEDGTVHFRRDLYKKDATLGVDQLASSY
jgi:lipoprotein-anchoring transpeptidase ErfK/SrfK